LFYRHLGRKRDEVTGERERERERGGGEKYIMRSLMIWQNCAFVGAVRISKTINQCWWAGMSQSV
jgi:hypothetical protein